MNAEERARRREQEYRLYFRLMKEGLQESSIAQFKDEMSALAENAIDCHVRNAALRAITRYDTPDQNPSPAAVPAPSNA